MGWNLWFTQSPLTAKCRQDRRGQRGSSGRTPIRKPLGNGGERQRSHPGQAGDRPTRPGYLIRAGGQGSVQVAPHGVAWEVHWIATWTNTATGTCRQHQTQTHMTDTDPQPQTWTDGDTATPMSREPQPPGQSHGCMRLKWVGAHSPRCRPRGRQ